MLSNTERICRASLAARNMAALDRLRVALEKAKGLGEALMFWDGEPYCAIGHGLASLGHRHTISLSMASRFLGLTYTQVVSIVSANDGYDGDDSMNRKTAVLRRISAIRAMTFHHANDSSPRRNE